MEKKLVIIVPQEYIHANHKPFWEEFANKSDYEVIVINIYSDLLVTTLKRKFYRLFDLFKPIRKSKDSITLVRMFSIIRPEIAPKILYKSITKGIWKKVSKMSGDSETTILFYNPLWMKILTSSQTIKSWKKLYFIIDDLALNAHSGKKNIKMKMLDEYACKNCDYVFTMSQKIKVDRNHFTNKITVIGNGAVVPTYQKKTRIPNSTAFIGNFRNWIDFDLLNMLIRSLPNINFYFVGPVQGNVKKELDYIISNYSNTYYLGIVEKEKVSEYYSMFNSIIVPYKQNIFMSATRPIKIVEAIFSGTPVVTIPIDGYSQRSFLQFATTASEFKEKVLFFNSYMIDKENIEYRDFISSNSWESVVKKVIASIEKEG